MSNGAEHGTAPSGAPFQYSRMSHSAIILGLVIAVNVGVVFAGVGMLWGKFEGPNYLAVISGLFGLIGGGALGMAVPPRAPQRSTDPPGFATAYSSTTTTSMKGGDT